MQVGTRPWLSRAASRSEIRSPNRASQSLGRDEALFAPPIGGRVLDAKGLVDGEPVFFEVVAPERPNASAAQQQLVDQLTKEVRESVSKCRVEIEIRNPMNVDDIRHISGAVQSTMPSVWTTVDSVARVRRINRGQTLLPLFDGGGAQVVVGGERTVQGASTSVVTCPHA